MEEYVKKAIETYQCPGCVCGSDISCYIKGYYLECASHVAGTTISGIGRILLGMPTGFCRLGVCGKIELLMHRTKESSEYTYDMFNIPVWKYLDKHGNTLVRGLSPRINKPWIHIYLENCMNQIDCIEITQKDVDEMD
jgi:hypothetical protein